MGVCESKNDNKDLNTEDKHKLKEADIENESTNVLLWVEEIKIIE